MDASKYPDEYKQMQENTSKTSKTSDDYDQNIVHQCNNIHKRLQKLSQNNFTIWIQTRIEAT